MKQEQVFVVELKKHLEDPGHMIPMHAMDTFRGFVAETVDSLLDAFVNKDMILVEQMLKDQRKLRKMITEELRGYSDEAVVVSSKYIQTYNLINKMVQNEKRRNRIGDNMCMIEQSYSDTRKVLVYLYRHTHVQHKVLTRELDIPRSTLSDLLKVMEKAGCVEKISTGKFSFFSLTVEGRRYVKESVDGVEREVIIDQQSFRDGVQRLVEGKGNQNFMQFFQQRGYSQNPAAILETEGDGMVKSAKWKSCPYLVMEGADR